ncbi:hypothetical protein EDC04DRAFT_2613083 [Pisolithus marmoratus]|nr:hypothetical protein EDC04DRAFT_2613083 [Pisolithus marmoratus]
MTWMITLGLSLPMLACDPQCQGWVQKSLQEVLLLGTSEMPGTVRHSSHSRKGTGGQLVQIRNLEHMKTAAAPRPKHLHDLDAATEGDGVNPMVPSQPPPTPQTKTGGPIAARPDLLLPSNIQPLFSMVVLNQQFGFRLPTVGEVNSNINHGSQHDSVHCHEEIKRTTSMHTVTLPNSKDWLSCLNPVSKPLTAFLIIRLHGHTLSVVPNEDENYDPTGEGNYSDPPIDEALPSEDDHFAESVLQGGKAKPIFLPILNTQVRWNVVQIPMQASASSQLPQTQGMTHPPSATSQLLGGVNPPILPVGPAIQGAKPWKIQFYKPVVQDVLEHTKQFSYCNTASINSFLLHAHFNIKAIKACQSVMAGGLTIQMIFLWESLGNWHLALRKKAHIYVTQHYKWDPENCCEVNLGIVKDLLGDHGAFLRDGIDENLKVVLNEMVSSQNEVNFRKCDTSMIHAKKMKSLQIHWASLGR